MNENVYWLRWKSTTICFWKIIKSPLIGMRFQKSSISSLLYKAPFTNRLHFAYHENEGRDNAKGVRRSIRALLQTRACVNSVLLVHRENRRSLHEIELRGRFKSRLRALPAKFDGVVRAREPIRQLRQSLSLIASSSFALRSNDARVRAVVESILHNRIENLI